MTASPTVLLDVDGTLIDSFPGIRAGFLYALATVGWPRPAKEVIANIPGPPLIESLRALGMPESQVAEALDAYLGYMRSGGWQEATPYPGMADLLARWNAAGLRLATATSKSESFARLALDHFGMLEHLHFLGAAQEHGPRRSKIAVIEYTLAQLGISDTTGVIMVGDRRHDIAGGHHFGLRTIAVTWGYGTAAEHAAADAIATTPNQLERIINELSY